MRRAPGPEGRVQMRTLSPAGAIVLAVTTLLGVAQAQQPPAAPSPQSKARITLICPLMKAHKDSEMIAIPFRVNGMTVYACNDVSIRLFKKNPERFVHGTLTDPVSHEEFRVTKTTPKVERGRDIYLFASADNRATFLKAPAKYIHSARR